MKNKFLAAFLIALMAVSLASCYTSRKNGCPMANSNSRFSK
jgi:predicted small secreted protein